MNSQDKSQASFVAPGKISALAASPDGNYLAIATGTTIFIRQICTGKVIEIPQRHYQTITSIKFTDDGAHFISAGHDGYVFVWKLSSLLLKRNDDHEPSSTNDNFSHHSLPVSDVYVGPGGMRSIIVSVSLDRTCKIHDLASGTLLLNLVFPEALTAVTMDHFESNVYVGTSAGNIFEVNLQAPPRMKEYHIDAESITAKQHFVGHKNAITTLSISIDGETLVSGSADESVKFWNIPSKQLIRSTPHKGSITNAKFVLTPKAMFNQETKLNLITNKYRKGDENILEVLVLNSIENFDEYTDEPSTSHSNRLNSSTVSSNVNGHSIKGNDNEHELNALRAEVKLLKQVNKQLFEHSMQKTFCQK